MSLPKIKGSKRNSKNLLKPKNKSPQKLSKKPYKFTNEALKFTKKLKIRAKFYQKFLIHLL